MRQVLREDATAGDVLFETGMSRIVKGTNHSGDIAQNRAFNPTLAHGQDRFTLKINEDKIFAGPEDLAEMTVSMDPYALG